RTRPQSQTKRTTAGPSGGVTRSTAPPSPAPLPASAGAGTRGWAGRSGGEAVGPASPAARIPPGMGSTVPQLGHLIFRPAKVAFAWRKTPQEQWNEIDMARTPTFFPLSGRHPRAREGHGRYFARRILRVRSAYLISRLGGLARLFRRDVR